VACVATKWRATWIVRITQPEPHYKLIDQKDSSTSSVGYSACNGKAVAQVHTHPVNGGKGNPKPSGRVSDKEGDWVFATKCNVPVYVLSVDAIWKVLPGGNEPVFVQVAKNWL